MQRGNRKLGAAAKHALCNFLIGGLFADNCCRLQGITSDNIVFNVFDCSVIVRFTFRYPHMDKEPFGSGTASKRLRDFFSCENSAVSGTCIPSSSSCFRISLHRALLSRAGKLKNPRRYRSLQKCEPQAQLISSRRICIEVCASVMLLGQTHPAPRLSRKRIHLRKHVFVPGWPSPRFDTGAPRRAHQKALLHSTERYFFISILLI